MAVFSTGGIAPPSYGLNAGDLAVGSSVYLMMNGSAVEYLVVNQGNPNSALYDASCDGTWLLTKDIYESRRWHSSDVNKYESSTIHTYLNGTFLNLFDTDIKAQIKTVKLPYRKDGGFGGTTQQGSNGISAQIFLLSGPEVSLTQSAMDSGEGAVLSYFKGCATTAPDSKRIAYLNGAATNWWLRSPLTNTPTSVWSVVANGGYYGYNCSSSSGIRPALILPYSAKFDKDTLVLKG